MTSKLSRALRSLLLAALFVVASMAATPARAQEMDFDRIYAELEPYGTWFEHPVWGTVWRPRVDQDWRPYAHGSWLFTDDYGWYWEAEEPWGWAPFHYGRWLIDEDGAWIWIPDTEWGPAWVAWRWSDDYVGWAPLPPQASWGPDGELAFDAAFLSEPRYLAVWCFVRPHQLILPGLHRHLLGPRHALAIFRQTRAYRGPHKFDGRFVNTGFDVKRFERMTGRPIVRTRLVSVDNPQATNAGRAGGAGREIAVFKPHLIERPEGPARIHRHGAFDREGANAGERSSPLISTHPDRGQASPRPQGPLPLATTPSEADLRQRQQRSPALWGDADRGKGPPPGMWRQRPGGEGLPRAYTSPGGAGPGPATTPRGGPAATLRAPSPAPLPAVRAPSPEPRRPPPRKDEGRGPG